MSVTKETQLSLILQDIGVILEVPGGHQHANLPNALRKRLAELKAGNESLEATVNGVIEAIGGDWQDVHNLPGDVKKLVEAQNQRDGQEKTPVKGAVSDQWLGDVIDLLHLLAGDLAHDSRLVALTARQLILNAPRLCAELEDGVWHDWHGGECPIDTNDTVQARFRDKTDSGIVCAWELDWQHSGSLGDIVSWRQAN